MKTLEEASAIRVSDRELLGAVKQVIRGLVPGASVLLYGSVARGTAGPESDYHILVLSDAPLNGEQQREVRGAIYDYALERGVLISTTFFAKAEWDRHQAMPFHQEVDRDGIVI